jgi:hypothetical protein
MENWKTFYSNTRTDYQISDLGRIRNKKTLTIRKQDTNTAGYKTFKLDSKWYLVHRLVAKHFIGNIDGFVIHHKNNNQTDNTFYNLEITTQSQNILYSVKYGNAKRKNQHTQKSCLI